MDLGESGRILLERIAKLEPAYARHIIAHLLLQEDAEQKFIRYSGCSDAEVREMINRVKAELHQSGRLNSPPFLRRRTVYVSPPTASRRSPTHRETQFAAKNIAGGMPMGGHLDPVSELENQTNFLSLGDQPGPVNFASTDAVARNLGARRGRSLGPIEIPKRTCYFCNIGNCKHGSNCQYYHGPAAESSSQMLDVANEDRLLSQGSLDRLEWEIVKLLRSRNGEPISIVSLPTVYCKKYGKVLCAEGYIPKSQRRHKGGYSLTEILARLNNIRLIHRPHGHHAVILAEDAHKYMASSSGRKDPGPVVAGSRHIYITFSLHSTFTEKDVLDYFSTFGPVENLRLPYRKEKMFGFVTFESHGTVRLVLNKRNPHIVGDAQIVAKPYRERSMLIDRMDNERVEPPIFGPPPYMGMANEFQSSPPVYGNMGMPGAGLMEERQMPSLELQRRRHLAELQMARNQMAWSPMGNQFYFGDFIDGGRVSEENIDVSSENHVNQMLGFLNSDSDHDGEKDGETNGHTDRDSQDLNLPDSPFASPG